MMTIQTVTTGMTRNMMGDKDPISDVIIFPPLPHLNNFSCDLMAKNTGRFFDSIPFHDITATDAAGQNLNQQFTRANGWSWHLLQPHFPVVVIHRHSHGLSGQKSFEFGVRSSEI